MKKILILIIALCSTAIFAAKGTMNVDTKTSKVKWIATKVTGSHDGHIKLKKGNLVFKDRELVGGELVIDMGTITCDDVKSAEYNKKFVAHLNNDDFFSVTKFKTAKLVVKSARLGKGGHFDVTADLTIKGITKPIMFRANINHGKNGVVADAEIKFNRTHYGIKYGSGSYFTDLGDKMIHDDVVLKVKLSAK
ncbi:hypothetical protein A9Q84_18785 [Halobacteriovorax marinus]|uniref:Lipid/polyisoprenoid-binding YceI-like domain-containing protein n=1 Tax=Halobacteriovorax marinus TaxID=97084 RepID=A0A1Y5F8M1_9BACT|nr:hypothetical protein A9Q84_18785 [Halobacteriovorax marinus]